MITQRSKGSRYGPITRLMSPGDFGTLVKPFVFLDLFEADRVGGPGFAPHPHSGIATLTTFLEGSMTYGDSTGERGVLSDGSVEWMREEAECGTRGVRRLAKRCAATSSGWPCRRSLSLRRLRACI